MKDHGLGNALYVAGRDYSGETKQWDMAGGPAPMDQTNIRELAFERIGGLISGSLKYVTHFDPLSASYLDLSTLPTTDRIATLAHRETLGAPAASMVCKQINFDPTRDAAGAVMFSVEAQSNNSGIDWGVLATPGMRVDTVATNGASVDHGSVPPGNFGLQAYLHVKAVTGTPTIKLQGSSDDGVGDAYTDITGGSFGVATVGSFKIATSRTLAVERYLRVVTTGAFTTCTFAVSVSINDVAVPL